MPHGDPERLPPHWRLAVLNQGRSSRVEARVRVDPFLRVFAARDPDGDRRRAASAGQLSPEVRRDERLRSWRSRTRPSCT